MAVWLYRHHIWEWLYPPFQLAKNHLGNKGPTNRFSWPVYTTYELWWKWIFNWESNLLLMICGSTETFNLEDHPVSNVILGEKGPQIQKDLEEALRSQVSRLLAYCSSLRWKGVVWFAYNFDLFRGLRCSWFALVGLPTAGKLTSRLGLVSTAGSLINAAGWHRVNPTRFPNCV